MTRDHRPSPKIHLASLGCAKNLVDSERLLARLATAGALVGAGPDEADVIIVNTCGFIAPAVDESIRTIVEYAALGSGETPKTLIVMGCLPERFGDDLRARLPDVELIVGLHAHDAIVRACGLSSHGPDEARLLLTPKHTAYLRISDGCDNRCSYCTIPLIRGDLTSRAPGDILREAEDLVHSGVRELVVIGQDTTSYGTDLATPYPVHRLLGDLSKIEELNWIRLLYTHPAHFSDDLIAEYANNRKLCAYVDLPLQHLADGILQRMGRRVTQQDCIRLIERLRARVPEVAIRTTFIVGFPGETDADFQLLLNGVRALRFDHLGAFAYCAEPDTPAAGYPNQVPSKTVQARLGELMAVQQQIVFETNESMLGRTVEVLLDEPADADGVWVGRTQHQAPDVDSVTFVLGDGLSAGRFVTAELVGTEDYDLIAQA